MKIPKVIVHLILLLFLSLTLISQNDCQDDWSDYINDPKEAKSNFHNEYSYLILPDFTALKGKYQIDSFYNSRNDAVEFSYSVFSILANANRKIHYDIFQTKNNSGKEYKFLIISQEDDESCSLLFEFGAPFIPTEKIDLEAISLRRAEWIKICNQHNARALVQELYSENPIYFNHKPIITNREELIMDYSYMNDPSYSLNLSPIIVESVNDHIVIEIGQCSGSYNGKYILIWEKNISGIWKIKVDSNI